MALQKLSQQEVQKTFKLCLFRSQARDQFLKRHSNYSIKSDLFKTLCWHQIWKEKKLEELDIYD